MNEPGPERQGGDPACWAHDFEALLFGEPADGDEDEEEGSAEPQPPTR